MDLSEKTRSRLLALLTLGVFVFALVALHKISAEFTFAQLQQEVRAMSVRNLLLSAIVALLSYLLLTAFDWVGMKLTGKPVPFWQVVQTAFVANAFGHTLGMATFTGGAVRLRGYFSHGLNAAGVAYVVGSAGLGFLLGCVLCVGLALVLEAHRITVGLHIPIGVLHWIGIALLTGLVGLLGLLSVGKKSVHLFRRDIALPSLVDGLVMLFFSTLSLSCAAGALYLLLPAATEIGFVGFIGLYLIAIAIGVVSHVPGGLGVFEATMLVLLPSIPAPTFLGAALVYRVLYFFLPFGLACILVVARFLFARWERLRHTQRRREK
jgi:phosphatidylglycerol lysyltransferase